MTPFKQRFQYYKLTGKLPYKAGRIDEELLPHYTVGKDGEVPTDAIQRRQMPIELQLDPLGMLRRLDAIRANAARVAAMLNQAQVGTETRTASELQRVNRQAAVDRQLQRDAVLKLKNEEAFLNLLRLASPSTYIGQAVGRPLNLGESFVADALTLGGLGALKRGISSGIQKGREAAVALTMRPLKRNMQPNKPHMEYHRAENGILKDLHIGRQYKSSSGREIAWQDAINANKNHIMPATINLEKPLNNIVNRIAVEKPIPYSELQAFKNSTLERMADARGIIDPIERQKFIQKGMSKVGTKYNETTILSNPRADGTTDPLTGQINIKPGSEEFALSHEMRHKLDDVDVFDGDVTFKLTPEEYGTLRKAYTGEFLDYPADYPMLVEMVTTNGDVRKLLLGKLALRDLSVTEQNAKIDAATGTDILNALRNSNGYGEYYYKALMTNPIYRENGAKLMIDIIRNIKTAMKIVGAYGAPIGITIPQLNNTETKL